MESFHQLSSNQCPEKECTSVALNGKYCLKHGRERRQTGNGHTQPNVSSFTASYSGSGKAGTRQDSQHHLGKPRPEEQPSGGQSRYRRKDSRDNMESIPTPSASFQTATKKSNLPPDLTSKLAMTARKSIPASNMSKKQSDSASSTSHPNQVRAYTGGPVSPTNYQRPVSGAFNPFHSFLNTTHAPSPNNPQQSLRNKLGHDAPNTTEAFAEARGQRKVSVTIPSTTNLVAQRSQDSYHPVAKAGSSNGTSVVRDLDGRSFVRNSRNESEGKTPAVVSSSAPSDNKIFDSLPCVRTKRLPPMRIKSAPSASRSAATKRMSTSSGKRKRGTNSDSTSPPTSQDDTDEYETAMPHREHEGNAAYFKAHKTVQVFNGAFSARSDLLRAKRQNRIGATSSALVVNSSSNEDEDTGEDYDENVWQSNPVNGHNHYQTLAVVGDNLAADIQRSTSQARGQQRQRPVHPRKKLTCEERRLQMCANFDSAKFDAEVYGQVGAFKPPPAVFELAAPNYHSTTASDGGREQLYMKLDPRIHWPHNRSEQWYKLKMDEIKARGGRKANFGQAALRMRQRRLMEERRAKEEEAAAQQGAPVPPSNSPQPWSHHRYMDFGDVPEQELPTYVRKNPEWVRAAAWMRENREQNLQRNAEAAVLRAAGQPWEHLFSQPSRTNPG